MKNINSKVQDIVHHILSVGMGGTGAQRKPLATVRQFNLEIIAYRLPEEL